MEFLSLEPFVPSGKDLQRSKALFVSLGFKITWEAGDLIGFERNECRFILQKFDDKAFAENFMLSIKISNAKEFYEETTANKLVEKFGIRISPPQQQPYGIEVNMIDLAGVCWHFIE